MPGTGQHLSQKEQSVVRAMLVSDTQAEAAAKAKVHPVSVSRMLSRPKVSKELSRRQAEQSDKAGRLLKTLASIERTLTAKAAENVSVSDWKEAVAGLRELLNIKGMALDIKDRAGESVEDTLTWRDHQAEQQRRRVKLATALRWAVKNKDRATALAQHLVEG